MKIFIGHSSNFDYQEKLYKPLKKSSLWVEHEYLLPRDGEDLIVTKEMLTSCDVYIGDVSTASTGEGIELGWCDTLGIPHFCIAEEGSEPSHATYYVTDTIHRYKNAEEYLALIKKLIHHENV